MLQCKTLSSVIYRDTLCNNTLHSNQAISAKFSSVPLNLQSSPVVAYACTILRHVAVQRCVYNKVSRHPLSPAARVGCHRKISALSRVMIMHQHGII